MAHRYPPHRHARLRGFMTNDSLTVIHVGDDPDNHRLIVRSLDETPDHGVELIRFKRIDEALEYNESHAPDIVLLDLVRSDFREKLSLQALPSLFPDQPLVALVSAEFDAGTMRAVGDVTQDCLVKEQLNGPLLVHALRQAVRYKAEQSRMRQTRVALEDWVEQRTRDLTRTNKALLQEIEERKRVQHDLAESRRMLRTVTDNIPALVAFVDKDRYYRFANRNYETIIGRSVKNIVGSHVNDVLGELYEKQARQYVDAALAGQPVDYEINLVIPSTEETRWLHIHYIPSFNDRHEVEGYFVLGSDITERKQNERSLREHRELLQSILDGMGAAVFFVDTDNFWITDANEIAETLVGLPRREIITMKCHDLICHDADSAKQKGCTVVGTKSLNTEFTLKRPDGRLVPVLRSVLPVTISGRPHHVAILFDITERKAMERQLAYAQKLESVGQLAAGIAHEINTPIQYIGNNLQFIRQVYEQLAPVLAEYPRLTACLEDGRKPGECNLEAKTRIGEVDVKSLLDEVPQALKESLEGVERVAGIVLAMKKFSYPDVEDWKLVNLNEAIKNTVTITRNEWKHVADIELDLDEDLPLVSVVPGDINQVILNLLVNAAHAIRDKVGDQGKGTITIRTRPHGHDQVDLSLTDTGTGIPEEHRSRIFDPFFTTKEVGKGTGQGLAITLSVIKKHEGSIDFESVMGQGTTFTVQLPIKHQEKDA